jgi:thiamine pyrophosphate-dependent acetolactate synthase large subunit-like protein
MTAVSTPTMTGGEAVVQALRAHGVELVFGIPGTHTLPIHRHLAACGIRHVTPRHEQGGGYAADGYARISGRPGVVLATSGPGVINAATAAATAYADSVPMLVVSPAMPTDVEGRDTGYLHEGKDQGAAMGAVTAWSRRAGSPAEAAAGASWWVSPLRPPSRRRAPITRPSGSRRRGGRRWCSAAGRAARPMPRSGSESP